MVAQINVLLGLHAYRAGLIIAKLRALFPALPYIVVLGLTTCTFLLFFPFSLRFRVRLIL